MKRISVLLSALAMTAGVAALTPAFAKTSTANTSPKASKMVAGTTTPCSPAKKGYSMDATTGKCVKTSK